MERGLNPSTAPDAGLSGQQQRRGYWLRVLHAWHWISSAVCLIGMLLFATTGITLNHAAQIEAKPEVRHETAQLPAPLQKQLAAGLAEGKGALPQAVGDWLQGRLPVSIGRRDAEWSADEVYVALPRPGGDAWLSIDRASGEVEFEDTDRGWLAYLNDLHKGRHAGAAWSWFLDVFAAACLLFSATGLCLLWLHARQRRLTWPYVGLGLLVPLLLALIFIH